MIQPRRLLISGGTVFDGVNDELKRHDILIEEDEIRQVGPGLTAEGQRFDARGKWIVPGFIDMHVHISSMGMEVLPIFVGTGVTTVRDVGGDTARLKQMKTDVESGKVVGPNLIYSGPLLQQHPARAVDERRGHGPGAKPFRTEAEAKEAVTRLIEEEGVGSIKIYESVREPLAAAILEAAVGRVPVTGHLGRTSSKFAMERGIGGLEHIHQSLIRDLAPPQRQIDPNDWLGVPGYVLTVLRAWAEVDLGGPEVESWLRVFLDTKSFLDPTITIFAALPQPDDPRLTLVPACLATAQQPPSQEGDVRLWAGEETTNRARDNQRGLMRLIYQHGGNLVVGTDFGGTEFAMLPGWAHHIEMKAFQNRGLKPIDILKATTSVSAGYLWRDDLGAIAPGKKADIVILDKDPTQDIANVDSISHVVKGGVLYESKKLLAIAEPNSQKFYPIEQCAIGPAPRKM